jgi:hypothetical protein
MIQAKVLADSFNAISNTRIVTMQVTFPRFILAEFNTHRMFSRNSASSRAIPFKKMLKSVKENPFIPIAWQKDHSGMQGTEYFKETEKVVDNSAFTEKYKFSEGDEEDATIPGWFEMLWKQAADKVIEVAEEMSELGSTKQIINRLLEPFMWHTVIVTATEWENFFALRCPQYNVNGDIFRSKKDTCRMYDLNYHADSMEWFRMNKGQAEIHMMALAEAMWDAYNESKPNELLPGQWHIPFHTISVIIQIIHSACIFFTSENITIDIILWTAEGKEILPFGCCYNYCMPHKWFK